MSTFTGIGPALAIDGPLPKPPKYRLLALPGVVREGEGRWQNGVNVYGYPSGLPSLWEPCASGTYRTKSDESEWPTPRFDPLAAYFPVTCSTISAGGAPEELAARGRLALEASISGAVEQALVSGVAGSTNPYFGDANMTPLFSGAAVTPEVGLAALEMAIGFSGRNGVIHATPGIAASWTVGNMIMDMDQDGFQETTGNYTPVAVGQGYTNSSPVGETAGSALTGQEWAYATGPVQVHLAPMEMLPGSVAEALERSENIITYRAEQYFLAYWDTALQAGVLIDWTSCCNPTPLI